MSHPARILIVEDQYFVAADCELQLHSAGLECVGLAATAEEAFELAQSERPDLILMDIRLAGRADGVEAAVDIYERLGIRCIFASAHVDEHSRRAERAHPLGWLDKPYTGSQLIGTIREALGQLESTSPRTQPEADSVRAH